jgi:hypothetical protein
MNPLIFSLLLVLTLPPDNVPQQGIEGKWSFVKDKSTDIATWRSWSPQIEIVSSGEDVTITHRWFERNEIVHTDSFAFRSGAGPSKVPVRSEIWTDNWFMGVLAKKGTPLSVTGTWLEPKKAIRVVTDQIVEISQGEKTLTTTREYRLDETHGLLTLTEQRATRPTPVILVFRRSGPE